MASRLELQSKLEAILGTRNVYFQPPPSIQMKYPAIVYERSNIRNTFANNAVYNQKTGYRVTVIDKNPDSEYVTKVSQLPLCSFVSHFESDNLNHDVFTIFN